MKYLMSLFRTKGKVLGVGLLMSIVLVACNKNDDIPDVDQPVAGLMAFNLAPDQPAIGVALSGSVLTNTALGYTNYTGTYQAIYPGTRSVQTFEYSNSNQLSTVDFNFESDKYYSAFLVGIDGTYDNVVVEDQFDSITVNTGEAYVRYINAIPDASSPTVTISSNGMNVVNDNASFKSVSSFSAIDAGDITINVTNGADITANRTISVTEMKAYTILLIGDPSSTTGVEIKFIENGTLSNDDSEGARTSTNARAVNSN